MAYWRHGSYITLRNWILEDKWFDMQAPGWWIKKQYGKKNEESTQHHCLLIESILNLVAALTENLERRVRKRKGGKHGDSGER